MKYKIYVDEYWVMWRKNQHNYRLYGPAMELADSEKQWYIDGGPYTEKSFKYFVGR